ncbi:MAG: cupin domain-containing protein [Acidobacteriota bacterium]
MLDGSAHAAPVSISSAEHYVWGGDCEGWHLLKRDELSVIQERVPPGRREVKHYHSMSRQFFYILDGEAAMVIGDEQVRLKKGEGVEVPPGLPHQFRNESGADTIFIVISCPKSHGDRVNVEPS